MSHGKDTKKSEGAEELPKQENVSLDAPSESSEEEMDDERRLIQALMTNPKDEANFLKEIKKMIKNNDPRLTYSFDGNVVENFLIPDQETQLGCLMDLFCEEKAYNRYKCTECGEERSHLGGMQRHLLSHSNCKFYFCVQCLQGCETLAEMALHRKTHDDAQELEVMRSSEGLQPPQSPKSEELERDPPEKSRKVEHRCSVCGSTFDRLDAKLSHTELEHQTERQ